MPGPRLSAVVSLVLMSAACGASGISDITDTTAVQIETTEQSTLPIVVANHGGSFEGHTPRGFPGSGTGLFAGDNLNS